MALLPAREQPEKWWMEHGWRRFSDGCWQASEPGGRASTEGGLEGGLRSSLIEACRRSIEACLGQLDPLEPRQHGKPRSSYFKPPSSLQAPFEPCREA